MPSIDIMPGRQQLRWNTIDCRKEKSGQKKRNQDQKVGQKFCLSVVQEGFLLGKTQRYEVCTLSLVYDFFLYIYICVYIYSDIFRLSLISHNTFSF